MKSIICWVALLCAAPAVAAPQPRADSSNTAQSVARELEAYGAFLTQLQQAQQPLHDRLVELQGRWANLDWSGDLAASATAFRSYSAEMDALILATDRQMATLPIPAVKELQLPADLMPARTRDEMMRMNRETGVLVGRFGPLLDAAIQNDIAAVRSAAGALLRSGRTLLESQILLIRASQAGVEDADSAWEAQNVDLILAQGMLRGLEAMIRLQEQQADPSFAADMRALAARARATGLEGGQKTDAELLEMREVLADARRSGAADEAGLARTAINILETSRPLFALVAVSADEFDRAAAIPDSANREVHLMTFMTGMRGLRLEAERHGQAALTALNAR